MSIIICSVSALTTPLRGCIIPGSRTEKIYLGHWDIDIFPIMEALVTIPGVEYVQPFFIYEFFDYIPGPIPDPEIPVIEGN